MLKNEFEKKINYENNLSQLGLTHNLDHETRITS